MQRTEPSTKRPAPRDRLPCDSRRRASLSTNERLTALAAIPLVGLLAVEGITLLFMGPLLSVHVFVGMLLVLPVALKLGSTGWRFLRYYLRDEAYVDRGPPQIAMRLLAPALVLSTISVLGTGLGLVFLSQPPRVLLLLHKASFIVWGPLFAVHFLVYVWRVPKLAAATPWVQRIAVAGVLAIAVVLAVAGYVDGHPTLHPFFDGDADAF